MSAPDRSELQTIRFQALAAKHLYEGRISVLRRASTLVDYLAIATPILYFPIRYVAKGNPVHGVIEGIWELLAALLVAGGLLKIFYRWPEKAERSIVGRDDNMRIADQARAMLTDEAPNRAAEQLAALRPVLVRQDITDQQELGTLAPDEKRRAYREAMKELVPGDAGVRCRHCGASPWSYRKGSCGVCGNTPVPS